MIDVGLYKRILDEGLLLDHFVVLSNLKEGKEFINNKRVQGFINLLCKKGFIDDGALTEKALLLLDNEVLVVSEDQIIEKKLDKVQVSTNRNERFDYATWVISLHGKLASILYDKTGKRQMRPKVDGKSYPFLPNATDLGTVLLRAINTYKLKDFDAIEKCLVRYLESCIKSDKWFPLMAYYIMKFGVSTMVTDMMEGAEEQDNDDTIVNI